MTKKRKVTKEEYNRLKKRYEHLGYFHEGVGKNGYIIGNFNCGCKFCKTKTRLRG